MKKVFNISLPLLIFMTNWDAGYAVNSVVEYEIELPDDFFELSPVLWNVSAEPVLHFNYTIFTAASAGRIVTLTARSAHTVGFHIFTLDLKVVDSQLLISMHNKDSELMATITDANKSDGSSAFGCIDIDSIGNVMTLENVRGTDIKNGDIKDYDLIWLNLKIGAFDDEKALISKGDINIYEVIEIDEIGATNDTDMAEVDQAHKDLLSELLKNPDLLSVNNAAKNYHVGGYPRQTPFCSPHERSQCQNAKLCARNANRTHFTCFCERGYAGKYCQFSLLPRTCIEAVQNDVHHRAGIYEIDLDRSDNLRSTFANCTQTGETVVYHNVPENAEVRSSVNASDRFYSVSYRHFTTQHINQLKDMAATCEQTILYECLNSPLLFEYNRTFFTSFGFEDEIHRLGSTVGLFGCECRNDGSCDTCRCDAGKSTFDNGTFYNNEAGIQGMTFLGVKKSELLGQGFVTLGPLKCAGNKGHNEEHTFTLLNARSFIELGVRDNVQQIEFEFRTKALNGVLFSGISSTSVRFSIELKFGHKLCLTINGGSLSILENVTSAIRLDDMNWHRVIVEVRQTEMRLTVDVTNVFFSAKNVSHLTMKMNVGDIESVNSVVGCFRAVRIGNVLQTIGFENGNISKGCAKICSDNKCPVDNGCVQNSDTISSICDCENPLIRTPYNSTVSFHDASKAYLTYSERDIGANPLISSSIFYFRTSEANGLLFYAHDHFDNFIQVHLKNKYHIVLTFSNLTQIKSSFSSMTWTKVVITQTAEFVSLNADNLRCSLPGPHLISEKPINRYEGFEDDDTILPPPTHGRVIALHPYMVIYVGGIPRLEYKSTVNRLDREDRLVYYISQLPSFMGCLKGLGFFRNNQFYPVDLENGGIRPKNKELVRKGCHTSCDFLKCANGGHCTTVWQMPSSLQRSQCDCSMTSFVGTDCTRDLGLRFNGLVGLGFKLSREERLLNSLSKIHSISFAFKPRTLGRLQNDQHLLTISFENDQQLRVLMCKNGSINVYTNIECYTVRGHFSDGYRHFFQAFFHSSRPGMIYIDEERIYLNRQDMIRLNDAEEFSFARPSEVDSILDITNNFDGAISNPLITFYGDKQMVYLPFAYYLNSSSELSGSVNQVPETAEPLTRATCGYFKEPNLLPIHQRHVFIPVWESVFLPIYLNYSNSKITLFNSALKPYSWVVPSIVALILLFFGAIILLAVCIWWMVRSKPDSNARDQSRDFARVITHSLGCSSQSLQPSGFRNTSLLLNENASESRNQE